MAIVDLLSTGIAVVSLLEGPTWRKKLGGKGKAKETPRGMLGVAERQA